MKQVTKHQYKIKVKYDIFFIIIKNIIFKLFNNKFNRLISYKYS